MTQLVVASTLFGAATAAAAVDSGLLGTPDGERVLLVVNNAPAPELIPAIDEIAGSGPVLDRFDRVVHLTNAIAPEHPSGWNPGEQDAPTLGRLLRSYWNLGDGPIDLVLESIAVNPAQALARVLHDSPVTVYSDGLMSYGPTRSRLPLNISQRLTELLHLDLVPGLRPVLLSEHGIPTRIVPDEAFRTIIEEIAVKGTHDQARVANESPSAIVVGQYLAALGLLTRAEEADLHGRMVEAAATHGARLVQFKPHPSAPPGLFEPLYATAKQAGVELEIINDPLPVEATLARSSPVAVVGCFSTALMTARSLFGVPSVAVDTELLLERLTPYENSNRVPVTIIDALHRKPTPYASIEATQRLVDTVSYCMQPHRLVALRPTAEALLTVIPHNECRRYMKKRRLRALRLPNATPHGFTDAASYGTRARIGRLLRSVAHRTPIGSIYRRGRRVAKRALLMIRAR